MIRCAGLALLMLAAVFPLLAQATDDTEGKERQTAAATQAGAAVQLPSAYGGSGWSVPKVVDPADGTERLLLLLPGGPVIVEAAITIDGKPFRAFREEVVAQALENADADKDGKVSWEECLKNASLGSRFAAYARDKATLDRTIQTYDLDKNGEADTFEVRNFIARVNNGPAFMLTNYAQRGNDNNNAALLELLDTDKNDVLSAEELAAAQTRLKSRDVNDDDILDLAELSGNAAQAYRGVIVRTGGGVQQAQASLIFHLADDADVPDFSALGKLLSERYAGKDGQLTADRMPLVPQLFESLDENADGELEPTELPKLRTIEPHVQVEINLGESGEATDGISLRKVADELPVQDQAVSKLSKTVTLELPTAQLQIVAGDVPVRYTNYDAQATALMTRYDGDKNNYLEQKEMGEQQYLVQQFEQWDADNDGKVYADEIKVFYRRSQELQWNRVSVAAANQGNALFAALDSNSDNRLGLREMRIAAERLKTSDKNDDGQITMDEVPGTVRLAIARGAYAYQSVAGQTRVFYQNQGANSVSSTARGPKWFVHMDRNGDGDLTFREFLGTREQFNQLDKNDDGFIELSEAEAAERADAKQE